MPGHWKKNPGIPRISILTHCEDEIRRKSVERRIYQHIVERLCKLPRHSRHMVQLGPCDHRYACGSGQECAAAGTDAMRCAVAKKSSYSRWGHTCNINGWKGRPLCVVCCRARGYMSTYQHQRRGDTSVTLPPPLKFNRAKVPHTKPVSVTKVPRAELGARDLLARAKLLRVYYELSPYNPSERISVAKLKELVAAGTVTDETFIFADDFDDWRALADCREEFGIPRPKPKAAPPRRAKVHAPPPAADPPRGRRPRTPPAVSPPAASPPTTVAGGMDPMMIMQHPGGMQSIMAQQARRPSELRPMRLSPRCSCLTVATVGVAQCTCQPVVRITARTCVHRRVCGSRS